ncbi:hypothetical protein K438DRAFT_1974486 [Mycena galopus ATCC 62051]|nr:hypothetical protein K438DRAFT_1974486 [Mycena galopus ATCC 62051]
MAELERVRAVAGVGDCEEGREDTGCCVLLSLYRAFPFPFHRLPRDPACLIELRDLNDGITKQMRKKRHSEIHIVALGGANYRRDVAMLDDDGKEVPGTYG